MELRLGELLVESGVLTHEQVRAILEAQAGSGRPFGVLAEELFAVDPVAVEGAWARQYARLARVIVPADEAFDPDVLDVVTRRQAWQFRVLPVRVEGTELMLATTSIHVRRALRFAVNVIGRPVFLVLCEAPELGDALCARYPLPGMTPRSVLDDGMDRLMVHVTGSDGHDGLGAAESRVA